MTEPKPNPRLTVRGAIIQLARRLNPDIGDTAMIAEGEYGFWVGAAIYVSKSDVGSLLRESPNAAGGNGVTHVNCGNEPEKSGNLKVERSLRYYE